VNERSANGGRARVLRLGREVGRSVRYLIGRRKEADLIALQTRENEAISIDRDRSVRRRDRESFAPLRVKPRRMDLPNVPRRGDRNVSLPRRRKRVRARPPEAKPASR